jgi:hypothetical protein
MALLSCSPITDDNSHTLSAKGLSLTIQIALIQTEVTLNQDILAMALGCFYYHLFLFLVLVLVLVLVFNNYDIKQGNKQYRDGDVSIWRNSIANNAGMIHIKHLSTTSRPGLKVCVSNLIGVLNF